MLIKDEGLKKHKSSKIYTVAFMGRPIGAIGKFDRYCVVVRGGNDPEEVRQKLYATHEHISCFKIIKVVDDPWYGRTE